MTAENKVLYLSSQDVERVSLEMPVILDLLERAFLEKEAGQIEMPPKIGIHTQPDAFIHAMPAYLSAASAAGLKWVSAYPQNLLHHLPYINGLIILNDILTGIPYAILNCAWITAYRTGAATALAARSLARPDSQVVGILACGLEGRSNLIAICSLFPIRRVYAYDISPVAQQRYIAEMSSALNVEVIGVSHPRQAVENCDIVVTSEPIQKRPTPTIQAEWVSPGTFASAVDFGSYWATESLAQFDALITDDLPQYRYYQSLGYFSGYPEPSADLGKLISAAVPGRKSPEERCMAINLGLAMEDLVVAQEIYRRAMKSGVGTLLSL